MKNLIADIGGELKQYSEAIQLRMAWHVWHCDEDLAARLLLDFGADPALCNDQGQAPLAGAAYKGDAAMVALLLERSADVGGAMPDGRTALMMAAMFNRCDVVDLLLRQGARADARDAGGLTALDVALIIGAPDTPQQLAAIMASSSVSD